MDSDETRNERCIKREKEGHGTRDAVRPFSFSDRAGGVFNLQILLAYSTLLVLE